MDRRKFNGTFKQDNKYGKKYDIDESCFDIINCELKAYCLGFLYADGNVGIYNNDYLMRLNLNVKDSEILDIFIKCLKTNRKWKIDGRGDIVLCISNKKICLSLINKGVVQRKTFKIQFPDTNTIPDHLMGHFIRGYFDGDGTIHTSTKHWNRSRCSIISNYDFITGLQNYILQFGFSKTKINKVWSKKFKTKKCGVIHFGGFYNIKRIYEFLYKNATFFLKRKKDKFIEYFELRDKNIKKDWNKIYSFELISPLGKYHKFNSLKELSNITGMCKGSYYKLIKNKTKYAKGWGLPLKNDN
jgi:hypothetical protein